MMKKIGRRTLSVLLVALILISSLTLSAAAADKTSITFNLYPVIKENAQLIFTSTINGKNAECLMDTSYVSAVMNAGTDENDYRPINGFVKAHFIGVGDVIFGSTLETGMKIQNTSNTADIICNFIMEDGIFNYDQCENCRIDQKAATITIPKSSTAVLSFTTPKSMYKSMYFTLTNFKPVKTTGKYNIGVYFEPEVEGTLTVNNLADNTSANLRYDEEGEYSYAEFKATYADGMTFSYDNTADPSYTCVGLIDDYNNFYGLDSVLYPGMSTTLYPVILNADMPLFKVENMAFTNFNEAMDAAVDTLSKRVVLIKDGVLSAGNYTIPEGVTLLIPFDDANTMYTDQPASVQNAAVPSRFCYRKLTMLDGAHITVSDGAAISVSAKHPSTTTNSGTSFNGAVAGGYGQIDMKSGSTIVLNGASNLYAWGYITGDGFIEANSGSTVYEFFQINDFRGGTITSTMADPINLNQFPLNQYYVQNIESHLRVNYGASEKVLLELYAGGRSIGFICSFIDRDDADECMFRLKNQGSYLEKYYNYSIDKNEFTMKGDADIDAITLSLSGVTISSADYYLPISNIDVTILSGSSLTTDKKIIFLPGSSVTVEKDASIIVTTGEYTYVDDYGYEDTKICVGSVIFAAKDDIGKYSANGGTPIPPCKPVLYTPTSHPVRTWDTTPEVFLNNNGTITVEDGASVSATSEKAQIYSSTGDGVFELNGSNATSVILTCYQSGQGDDIVSADVPIVPALIQDEINDGSSSDAHSTGDTWGIPAVFKKVNGVWGDYRNVTWLNNAGSVIQTCEDLAYDAFMAMDQPEHEDKPDDDYGSYNFLGWVLDTVTTTEVTVVQDYRLIRPDCELTWIVDDEVYATTYVPYLENATFDGVEMPFKAADAQYKYSFVGWTIDGDTIYTYEDSDLPVISDDTTFTAVFSTEDVIYQVWFRLYDINAGSETLGISMNVKYGTELDNLYNDLYSGVQGKPNLVERLKEFKGYTDDFSFVGWGAHKIQAQAKNNAKNYIIAYQPDETIVIDGTQLFFCAAFVKTTGVFTNHSISLDDKIDVNYYIALPDGEDVNSYTIGYTFRGEYKFPLPLADYLDTEYTEGVRYKFSVAADAPQMTDGITAILYKDGKPVDSDLYRVVDYSKALLDKDDDAVIDSDNHTAAQVKPLVRSMLNYGAKAQAFFAEQEYAEKVNSDSAANYIDHPEEVDYDEVTDEQLSAVAPADSTNLNENMPINPTLADFGLKYHGVSAVLDSKTSLRLYFQITDETKYNAIKDSITFGFNNESVSPVIATANGKFIYVACSNIEIANLNKPATMSINGVSLIKYSVMDYLKKAFDNEKTMLTPNEKLISLITAMYHYNREAVTYFGA